MKCRQAVSYFHFLAKRPFTMEEQCFELAALRRQTAHLTSMKYGTILT